MYLKNLIERKLIKKNQYARLSDIWYHAPIFPSGSVFCVCCSIKTWGLQEEKCTVYNDGGINLVLMKNDQRKNMYLILLNVK